MTTRHVAAEHAEARDLTPQGVSGAALRRFRKRLASDGFTTDEGWRPKPGYLYTVVRAISARVNQNWDGWPSSELKKSYKTFLGKPCFVNHENHDPTKARGVVVAARYVENGMDKYIEVVQEIDAERFPKLAHEIKTGGLDSVSMGAEAGFTVCSYCHNKATDLDDMCDHVRNHKGKTLARFDKRTGKKEDVLVFESCHKISFFELSYVFEPADETAVASKVVVAGLDKTAGDMPKSRQQLEREWALHKREQEQYKPQWDENRKLIRWNRGTVEDVRPGDVIRDPNNLMHFGPVESVDQFPPPDYPTFPDDYDDSGNLYRHYTLKTTVPNGTSQYSLRHDKEIEILPRDGGRTAGIRTAGGDLAVPAPPGTPTIDQSVIDATPVIELNPATELTGHEAPGVPKSSGRYTKEDFAAAGDRKPWEPDADDDDGIREIEAAMAALDGDPSEEADDGLRRAREYLEQRGDHRADGDGAPLAPRSREMEDWLRFIERRLAGVHKHSAECIPGVNCRGSMPQGEQIFKDSPNNPVNQPSATQVRSVSPGGGGSGGSPSSGGLNPAAQAFYDQLAADYPGVELGGYNPVVDQPWDEHATGDAIDFMTTDLEQGNAIRDRALANGAKHVIWQQKLWYPGGGVEDMEDRGSPTENHYDHVHINLPTPSGWKPGTSSGSGASGSASEPMMQATPTGLQPAQRAAAVNPAHLMPRLPRMALRTASADMIPGFIPTPGARPIDFSKPVFVHTNRHAVNAIRGGDDNRQDIWSIKQEDPETGIHVRGYAPEVHLVDNRFNVQQAGAQKFKDTRNPDGTGGQRVVHAGVYGYVAPTPAEPQEYSLTDYHPGFHTTFVHRDNGEPVHTADHVHFTPDVRMYSAQADNWGRDRRPVLIFEPHPSLNASNLDTVGGEPHDRPPLWGDRTATVKTARRAAMKKTARTRALRLAWGEIEAPTMVDTLREEGSAPEDENNDFERYVDPPQELADPDLSEAARIDRKQQESAGPGGEAPTAAQGPQDGPRPGFITLQVPIPAGSPQVPQNAVPPQPGMAPPAAGPGPVTASMLDWFDRYYGRRVANWMDAIEAGRGMTPAEAADYRRQASRFQTLENGPELSTTNRNPTKGTSQMARSSNANRSKVARGRRQHNAGGPLVDGGDRSRNDLGEQEEAFISQTPPEQEATVVTDSTHNITNTESNLVARVQRGRDQLMRDARALAAAQRKRSFEEAGGPTAEVVDPVVNSGKGGEALTGDGFVSADPNDGATPTNPKDASLRAFAAFDSWLAQKTGKSSRRHTEATIKKAAAQFSREAGISPQALFPALGIVLREARKGRGAQSTRGAKMRKRSNDSLEVAAPDARIDVEVPVKNTDAEAQASQFDIHDFGNNAGDDVANPDLRTDQNWAPGEASKTGARVKTAGGLLAMRCAEGMIAAGLEPDSRERKYQLAAEFEQMNRGLIQDRVALLERFAAVRQAERRKVASGGSRGAARSPIPAGMGGGARTASAPQRLAAHDPRNDSSLFI